MPDLKATSWISKRWADLACPGILLAAALWIGLPRYSSGLDLGDEATLAYGAVRVSEGQVPNRDFVSIQGPLSFYVIAAVFKLFGTSLLTLHAFGLCLYCLVPLLAYAITRQFGGPVLAFAAAAPLLLLGLSFTHFVPYPMWQGLVVVMAAASLYLKAMKRATDAAAHAAGNEDKRGSKRTGRDPAPEPGRSLPFANIAAGALLGVGLLLRQDMAVYLLIAATVYAVCLHWVLPEARLKRPIAFCALGLGLVLLPLGCIWVVRGAAGEMFRQLLLFPVRVYPKTSSLPFPRLQDAFVSMFNTHILLYYIVPVVVLAAAGWLVRRAISRRFEPTDAAFAFMVVWSGLFYGQVLVRTDLPHLLAYFPPFVVLAAECFRRGSAVLTARLAGPHGSPDFARGVVGAGAAIVIGFYLLLFGPSMLQAPLPAHLTVRLPKAGVRIPANDNLENLVHSIQQLVPTNRSILSLPYQPMLYFLCERRNPTHWNYLWPGDQTTADHEEFIRQARRDPPGCAVIFEETKFQEYAPALVDYIHKDFTLAVDADGVVRIYLAK